MQVGLSGAQLLDVWEQGQGRDPIDRGLVMWRAAEPDVHGDELAAAPLGRRDAALLRLRRSTFGPQAECFVVCPDCGEQLEFAVDVDALVVDPAASAGPACVAVGDWQVRFRLPGTADLQAVGGEPDPWLALARRCVVDAERSGSPVAATELPVEVAHEVDAWMGRLDSQAELLLEMACAGCGNRWNGRFDIGTFLWREIEVASRRLLAEVDTLARVYGWSEDAILALPPARRRSYLELVGAL
ncbi:T4 family baseplate hub assembly chaperone [Geodermatophilus sp. SYSU D00710]